MLQIMQELYDFHMHTEWMVLVSLLDKNKIHDTFMLQKKSV